MGNPLFWTLWTCTLLLCGWVMVDAVRKPHRLFEWPFLVAAMWMYFYVYMSFDAALELSDVISPKALVLGQLLPLLSFAGLLTGWNIATPKGKRRPKPYQKIKNRFTIWLFGILLIIVGSVGGYLVQGVSSTGYQVDVENTSAYFYLLFYVGYPGMALAFWVAAKKGGSNRKILWVISVIGLSLFLLPHISSLRRGPTFPAILLILLVSPLAQRRAPNVLIFFGGLACAGLVMLLYLQLRGIMYNDGTWEEALAEMRITDALTDRNKNIYDNEFINNCHLIEALSASGKYQYGTGHFSLLLHWIPSSIWKGKGALGEGYYSNVQLVEDVAASAGVKLLGGGAAAGGVADSFVQYGYLAPVFWFCLGWLASKTFWKGRHGGSVIWMNSYIAFLCATHWLISQGFAASFVPLLIFVSIPVLALFVFGGIRYQRNKPRRSRGQFPQRQRRAKHLQS